MSSTCTAWCQIFLCVTSLLVIGRLLWQFMLEICHTCTHVSCIFAVSNMRKRLGQLLQLRLPISPPYPHTLPAFLSSFLSPPPLPPPPPPPPLKPLVYVHYHLASTEMLDKQKVSTSTTKRTAHQDPGWEDWEKVQRVASLTLSYCRGTLCHGH